jgi:ArsR family transcriptional regulator, arsenate/arsenite/antimonite-responsive transcriptional repressor
MRGSCTAIYASDVPLAQIGSLPRRTLKERNVYSTDVGFRNDCQRCCQPRQLQTPSPEKRSGELLQRRRRFAQGLDAGQRFDNARVMESTAAIGVLAALAQDSRLQVYRLLVQAGPEGVAASEIAGKLGIPANTLSFHLKTLNHADLVLSRQEGRFVYYSANYERMNALLGFLTENCCGGRSCLQTAATPRKRKAS